MEIQLLQGDALLKLSLSFLKAPIPKINNNMNNPLRNGCRQYMLMLL